MRASALQSGQAPGCSAAGAPASMAEDSARAATAKRKSGQTHHCLKPRQRHATDVVAFIHEIDTLFGNDGRPARWPDLGFGLRPD